MLGMAPGLHAVEGGSDRRWSRFGKWLRNMACASDEGSLEVFHSASGG